MEDWLEAMNSTLGEIDPIVKKIDPYEGCVWCKQAKCGPKCGCTCHQARD